MGDFLVVNSAIGRIPAKYRALYFGHFTCINRQTLVSYSFEPDRNFGTWSFKKGEANLAKLEGGGDGLKPYFPMNNITGEKMVH